ncbi:MAG: hypothetical protein ACYDCC_13350 [Actinomycetota bacterium]
MAVTRVTWRSTKLVAAASAAVALLAFQAQSATALVNPPLQGGIHKMLTLQEQIAKSSKDCALPVGVLLTCFSAGLPMTTSGGPIQTNPSVYIVRWHWTSDPKGELAYQENFFKGVGASSFAQSQTQYCDTATTFGLVCPASGVNFVGNPSGLFKSEWDDSTSPAPPTSSTDTAAITGEAIRAAAHFGTAGNPNAQYIIDLPPTFDDAFNQGFCAYHGSVTNSSGNLLAYTFFPYIPDGGVGCGAGFVHGDLDGVSIVGGHEFAETITDVSPNSGWSDVLGQETGDKCAFIQIGPGAVHNLSLSTGNFAVQSLWSNKANAGLGGCV